ncbi:MAG: DUF3598 family protein [Rivularia sp. (in: cyanobacteria)]
MDLKEKNWNNLCAKHIRDWQGIWTRYSPQKAVTESFRSLRSFRSNPQQTEIAHTNRYMYADGTTKEESWEYNLHSNGLSDGLFHPARDYMRGLNFEQGAAAWVTTQLKAESYFAVELFFLHENLRHSVGIVYDQKGNLMRTANIREDSTGFPSKYWSTDINQLPERSISGNWQGTSLTMTPDLKVSEPLPTQFHFSWEKHKTFFLPDGVSISCPEKVSLGTPFILVANWLVTNSQLQQISAKYDEFGTFSALTFECFTSA